MTDVVRIAQASPELLVFLALALGYFIGKFKIKGFGLGTTASVLIAAMALGQIPVEVPALLKNISFAFFAFWGTIGTPFTFALSFPHPL